MGETMERNLGVHGCPGLHSVTVGQASGLWHRRGGPFSPRGFEGSSLLVNVVHSSLARSSFLFWSFRR